MYGPKTWRISVGGQSWIASAGPAISASLLSMLIERALADPVAQRALCEIDAELSGVPLNGGATNQHLRSALETRLQDAFRQGRLRLIPQETGGGASFVEAERIAQREIDSQRQLARSRQERNQASEKTFIEIVLENQRGEPVGNALCHLKLSDGTLRKVRLDATGRLRVPGIDPGQCEVSFPEFDAGEWRQI